MTNSDDLTRLRAEYADRARRLAGSDIYSLFNRAHLFAVQQRQRDTLSLLRCHGFYPLEGRRILEVGCGNGGVLLEYLAYGAAPSQLHGTDLLFDRVTEAKDRLSHLPLTCADGQNLPYADDSFDLVLQYTVFTSILNEVVKANLAGEMLRVIRKPTGKILWYDYWINPTNPQTRGIRPTEIRQLFPGCALELRRITLAPPLARRLVPFSWILASLLERLRLLNCHYLVVICPAH